MSEKIRSQKPWRGVTVQQPVALKTQLTSPRSGDSQDRPADKRQRNQGGATRLTIDGIFSHSASCPVAAQERRIRTLLSLRLWAQAQLLHAAVTLKRFAPSRCGLCLWRAPTGRLLGCHHTTQFTLTNFCPGSVITRPNSSSFQNEASTLPR
jgi:hypothetical protein